MGQPTPSLLAKCPDSPAGNDIKSNPFGIIDLHTSSADWRFNHAVPYANTEAAGPHNEPTNEIGVSREGTVYSDGGGDLASINRWARSPVSGVPFFICWHGVDRAVLSIRSPVAPQPTVAPPNPADAKQPEE